MGGMASICHSFDIITALQNRLHYHQPLLYRRRNLGSEWLMFGESPGDLAKMHPDSVGPGVGRTCNSVTDLLPASAHATGLQASVDEGGVDQWA